MAGAQLYYAAYIHIEPLQAVSIWVMWNQLWNKRHLEYTYRAVFPYEICTAKRRLTSNGCCFKRPVLTWYILIVIDGCAHAQSATRDGQCTFHCMHVTFLWHARDTFFVTCTWHSISNLPPFLSKASRSSTSKSSETKFWTQISCLWHRSVYRRYKQDNGACHWCITLVKGKTGWLVGVHWMVI